MDSYIKNMSPGAVRVSSSPFTGWNIVENILKERHHRELMGSDDKLNLTKSLENAKNVPPIWALHGQEDTIVRIFFREMIG